MPGVSCCIWVLAAFLDPSIESAAVSDSLCHSESRSPSSISLQPPRWLAEDLPQILEGYVEFIKLNVWEPISRKVSSKIALLHAYVDGGPHSVGQRFKKCKFYLFYGCMSLSLAPP